MQPFCRPHCTSYPSFRLSVCLSVCPSLPYRLVTLKQKKTRKIIIGIDIFNGVSKCSFQLKNSKVKVTGRKSHTKMVSCGPIKRQIWRRLQTRHTPLLGLSYCRCLARDAGRMATCFLVVIGRRLWKYPGYFHKHRPITIPEETSWVFLDMKDFQWTWLAGVKVRGNAGALRSPTSYFQSV